MQHNIIKTLAILTMGTMLLVACDPDDMFDINDTIPTDTVPQQPEAEPFSISGTAWMAINDEWWSSSMHVIDTSIWRFMTDSTGTIYEHWIYNDDDPYGGNTYPMTYTFDIATMTGILHGYQNSDFSDAPIEFTYHPEDTTITYGTSSNITYHPLME